MSKVPGGPGIPSAPGSPGRPSGPLCEQRQLTQFIDEAFLYKTIALQHSSVIPYPLACFLNAIMKHLSIFFSDFT